MDSDKKTPPAPKSQPPKDEAPADALSLTPEELEKEQADQAVVDGDPNAALGQPEKKVSGIKRLFRKVNVYFLVFILLVVVAGVIAVVTYLNSQKAPATPSIASQSLTQNDLKQLANTDVSVGNNSQTLTIQGNAIISGQTLTRGNLNVAGNIQTGGSIQAPSLTVSGTSNLGTAQIDSLQVATNTTIQGSATLGTLNVGGASSFSGPMTASQITVTKLILSGNASLQVPNHITFPGSTPSRTINTAVLGSGGSVSLNGSDTSGTVDISTGNNTVPGCFVQIKFNQPYASQPRVLISPVGAAAGQIDYYATRTTSGFSVCTASAAPTNQDFSFDYFVMG